MHTSKNGGELCRDGGGEARPARLGARWPECRQMASTAQLIVTARPLWRRPRCRWPGNVSAVDSPLVAAFPWSSGATRGHGSGSAGANALITLVAVNASQLAATCAVAGMAQSPRRQRE